MCMHLNWKKKYYQQLNRSSITNLLSRYFSINTLLIFFYFRCFHRCRRRHHYRSVVLLFIRKIHMYINIYQNISNVGVEAVNGTAIKKITNHLFYRHIHGNALHNNEIYQSQSNFRRFSSFYSPSSSSPSSSFHCVKVHQFA